MGADLAFTKGMSAASLGRTGTNSSCARSLALWAWARPMHHFPGPNTMLWELVGARALFKARAAHSSTFPLPSVAQSC